MMDPFQGNEPIYLQIAQQIREQILKGTLREGDQVMSTTQYAKTFRINPGTANRAFGLLTEEGIIEKRRGIGMFVCENAKQLIKKDGAGTYLEDVLDPAIKEGIMLGVDKEIILARTYELLDLPGSADLLSSRVSTVATRADGSTVSQADINLQENQVNSPRPEQKENQ